MDCDVFKARLVEFRRGRKWTQRQLGSRMAAEARQYGRPIPPVAKSTISSYESGQRSPDPLYALLLCRALERDPEELGLADVLTPERIQELTSTGSVIEGWTTRLTPLMPALPISAAGSWKVLALDWERMATLFIATRRLDQGTLTDLRRLTDFYGSQRRVLVPPALLPAVLAHLMLLRNQLMVAGTQLVRQELVIMAGEMAVVAGELWHTMLDYGEAAQSFRFALDLADEFGEGLIRATALTSLAGIYKNRLHQDEGVPGESRQAVHLMDAAQSAMGGDAPSHMRLWLLSARAWQHAALNEGKEAERDLEAAEGALAQTSGRAVGIFAPWDINYHLASRARVKQLLGRPAEAVGWYEKTVKKPDPGDAQDMMRMHFVLKAVAACLEAKQIDRAGSLLSGVVDMVLASGVVMLRRRLQLIVRSEPALAADASGRILAERLDDVVIK